MDYKNQIGKIIVALLLFLALMLPSAIKFIHLFESHNHVTCTEQTTHIHKSVVKCDICSLYLVSFDYDIAKQANFKLSKIPVKIEIIFSSLQYHSFKITNTQLRAPPAFS